MARLTRRVVVAPVVIRKVYRSGYHSSTRVSLSSDTPLAWTGGLRLSSALEVDHQASAYAVCAATRPASRHAVVMVASSPAMEQTVHHGGDTVDVGSNQNAETSADPTG